MSKDKDLESIKSGKGLTDSSITSSNNKVSGTTTEQRSQDSGIRRDTFTLKEENKKGGK